MTIAVCFKCGAYKDGAFVPCSKCGERPESTDDFARSIALSDHFCDRNSLAEASAQIKAGYPPAMDPSMFSIYRDLFASPIGRRMLALTGAQAELPTNRKPLETAIENAHRIAHRLVQAEADAPGTVRMRANPLTLDVVLNSFEQEFGLRKPFLKGKEQFLYDMVLQHDYAMARVLPSALLSGPQERATGMSLCWAGHGQFAGRMGTLGLFDFANAGMRKVVLVVNIEPLFGRVHDLLEAPSAPS